MSEEASYSIWPQPSLTKRHDDADADALAYIFLLEVTKSARNLAC